MSARKFRIALLACVTAAVCCAAASPARADGVYFSSPAQDATYVNSSASIPSFDWSLVGQIVYAECNFQRVLPTQQLLSSSDCFTSGSNNPVANTSNAPASYSFTWNVLSMILGDGTYQVAGHAAFVSIGVQNFSRTITLDTTAPQINLNGPNGWTTENTPLVSYGVTEANPGTTRCGVDLPEDVELNAVATCEASPVLISALADGQHSFRVFHTDLAGNTADSRLQFGVDTTGPEISISGVADEQTFTTPNVSASVSASDAGAGLAKLLCSWDGAEPKTCTSPDFTAATLGDGIYTLLAIATDRLGNVTTRSLDISVETDPVDELLAVPELVNFKLKRGKLKKRRYPTTFTAWFAIPLEGDDEEPNEANCEGSATMQVQYRSRQLGLARVTFAGSGATCRATAALKIAKKYRKKKLTLTLDYKSGPFTPFTRTSRALRL